MALTARELIACLQAMNEAERRELGRLFWGLPVPPWSALNPRDILVSAGPPCYPAPSPIRHEVLNDAIRTRDLNRPHDLPH